jgi:hypothetical protein
MGKSFDLGTRAVASGGGLEMSTRLSTVATVRIRCTQNLEAIQRNLYCKYGTTGPKILIYCNSSYCGSEALQR